MIVIAGCTLFGDPISVEQGFGFTAQLFFIFLWSVMTLVKQFDRRQGVKWMQMDENAEGLDIKRRS